ncbi:hypothetical protein ACVWXO_004369 [Bradyrhizobium sp. LM2.7]
MIVLVLEAARIGAVHVDRGDAKLERLGDRFKDAAAPIIRTLHLLVRRPALLDPRLDETREILVERALFTIGFVEPSLHGRARRHVLDFAQKRNAAFDKLFPAFHDFLLC